MKCPECGHENRGGAKFCEECATALGQKCERCGAGLGARAKFCSECAAPVTAGALGRPPEPRSYTPHHLAEKILTSRSALEGERKQVTILFADLKGSMDLSESVDPEEWHRIMERFFRILTDGVHRFEGTVNQYTGDGIMALFGAPIAHEDHAQRACYAALALQDDLRRYANQLRLERGINFSLRMGLNSGEVVVGKIGDDLRMDYTALGHTASLAARMEQMAEPGKVYLTEYTAKLVDGYVELVALGPMTIKGARDPVEVYELHGKGRSLTKLDVARARGFSRFVGRDREIGILEDALDHALRGDAQVVGIVAHAGIGKSRLCHEFVERCRSQGIRCYRAHAVAHGKAVPLLPILELYRDVIGIVTDDSAAVAREKIVARLREIGLNEDTERAVALWSDFLGVADAEAPSLDLDPEKRQRELFALIKRGVHARSRREVAVNLLEDLHWFDPASETLLQDLIECTAGTRTLLVVNFRPEYRAPWAGRSNYQQIGLAPLSADASAELLRDLLGGDASLESLAERIREEAGGNPFFIEELVRSLAETGALEGKHGRYRFVRSLDEVAIPSSVQTVLAARIDRLSERDKGVLQAASVIGKTFPEPVLRRVAELSEGELADAIGALRRLEFVYEEEIEPEPVYAFKHPLTQEVAYRSQLAERRRDTHAAVARALVDHYPGRLDERAAELAHHWESAGRRDEAAPWHARAAESAGVSDPRVALFHWTKVRSTLGEVPESSDGALELLACSRILQLGWRLGLSPEDRDSIFRRGRELAEQAGDRRALAMLLSPYSAAQGLAGDAREYVENATEAFRVARETDDLALILGVRSQLGYGLFVAGRFRELLPILDEGIANRPADLRLGSHIVCPYIMCFNFRGAVEMYTGRLADAAKTLDTAIGLASEQGDLETLSVAHGWRSELAQLLSEPEPAITHGRRALEAAEKIGSAFWIVFAHMQLARACLLRREWGEAVDRLRQVLKTSRGGRTGLEVEAFVLAGLAEAHLGNGDACAAREVAEEAVFVAEQRHTRFYAAAAKLALARVLLRTDGHGGLERVRHTLDAVRSGIAETGAMTYESFARIELAELARLGSDHAAWLAELREAHRLFLDIGAPVRAAEVAKELESRREAVRKRTGDTDATEDKIREER